MTSVHLTIAIKLKILSLNLKLTSISFFEVAQFTVVQNITIYLTDHGNHTENTDRLNLKLTLLRFQEVVLFLILVNVLYMLFLLFDIQFHHY